MSIGSIFTRVNLKKAPFHFYSSVLFLSGVCGSVNNFFRSTRSCSSRPMDPNSYSRPDLTITTSIFLTLDINFDRKVLSGSADLTIKKVDPKVQEVILDVKDLNIEVILETKLNKRLRYTVSDKGQFGSKLTVVLPDEELEEYDISVRYETSPTASGLQWLRPEQTAGKQKPFVFSQFQAIHARSVLPCQDTPSVKAKYSAVISAPKDVTVVMSAINDHKKPLLDRVVYHFLQDIPVQSYLIALAAGAIESRDIGPRTKVWAEKELIESAAYEFAQTESQLKTAEVICGPYVWGRYDLLVLPPSFPFGGMENPCLTFVTPTVIAGDRSLVNVVAHEIAHSWTGNLVTNANFEHFWLNEGFTMFIERKILGRLSNKQFEDFLAFGGYLELNETILRLGPANPLTCLVVNLDGVDPDDAFSTVPYEKGYIFLRYLEQVVGGPEVFEPFLMLYFETFKYKSLTTSDFMEFFLNHFISNDAIKDIDWQTWCHEPGMPPVIPQYDLSLRQTCEEYLKLFLSWKESKPFPISSKQIHALLPDQKIQFLQLLLHEDRQPIAKLYKLESVLNLKDVQNCELKFRWFRICIKAHWEEKIPQILDWLNEVGRMKYARPLYRDLAKWDTARDVTIKNFHENKSYMMYVTAQTIAKDLHQLVDDK